VSDRRFGARCAGMGGLCRGDLILYSHMYAGEANARVECRGSHRETERGLV
jgi:hypothetical protein